MSGAASADMMIAESLRATSGTSISTKEGPTMIQAASPIPLPQSALSACAAPANDTAGRCHWATRRLVKIEGWTFSLPPFAPEQKLACAFQSQRVGHPHSGCAAKGGAPGREYQ